MSRKTILVADDEADIRMLVRTLVGRAYPCDILEAADGADALATWREHSVDLAVLDQRMPELTGTAVAQSLRDESFDGPIVLFSAYLDPEIEEEAARLGLVTVPKSDIRRLVDVVRDQLGDAGSDTSMR